MSTAWLSFLGLISEELCELQIMVCVFFYESLIRFASNFTLKSIVASVTVVSPTLW